MAAAGLQIVRDSGAVVQAGVGKVAGIRIDAEPRAVDLVDVVHGLLGRVHERSLHGLKTEDDASAGSHGRGFRQIFFEQLPGLLCSFFIVDIVACQLDDADAKIIRQDHGFFHDLKAAGADCRIRIPEGIFPVPGEAHAADRKADFLHGVHQLKAFFGAPVQTGELGIGLVDADLQKIIPAFFGADELVPEGEVARNRLFIKSDRVWFHNRMASFLN